MPQYNNQAPTLGRAGANIYRQIQKQHLPIVLVSPEKHQRMLAAYQPVHFAPEQTTQPKKQRSA